MKKTSQTVIFFGSGPVAASALELLTHDFIVEAVITKPPADHHKGSVPVLELSEKLGLKSFTPTNKKELSQLFGEEPFQSQIGIVIDYGIIIGQDVIDCFPCGIINSHFSLLPQWRGADPITFSILSGQKQTGVSIMLINNKMDEGELLSVGTHELTGSETTPELTDQLITLSHSLLLKTIPEYLLGKIQPKPQKFFAKQLNYPDHATYSRKLLKSDGELDWTKPASQLEREIRAFNGWPSSYTSIFGKDIIITSAEVVNEEGTPGKYRRSKKELIIYCQKNALRPLRVKPAGKKDMPVEAFLSGIR